MKTKLPTRILSLLLCVLMCVSLLPTAAFAAEDPTDSPEVTEEPAEPTEEPEEPAEEPDDPTEEPDDPAEEPADPTAAPAEETAADPEQDPETPDPAEGDYHVLDTGDIIASGTCGDNLTWTLDDAHTLTISGTGPMTDWSSNSSVSWYSNSNYNRVETVVIEDGVTSIGQYAFYNCSNMTSITIGSGVSGIGSYAFPDGIYFTEINVSADNENYCSVNGVLFDSAKTTLVQYPAGKTNDSYSIPSGVTDIGEYAFEQCKNLTKVVIPDGVISIGKDAFAYCDGLTGVTIGNGVKDIGYEAFYGCGLTSVVIPDSVTSIGDRAFMWCDGLTSVTIGNGVTSIGDSAFYGCGLTSVVIPDNVTSIGYRAFYQCALTSVTIGNGVTGISNETFYRCHSLKNVTIGNSVETIGNYAFYECYWLESVEIPDSVTSIENYAFMDCHSLASLTIGSSVTSIGEKAFYKCQQFTSLIIPDSVTSIGDGAFEECFSLASVTIGKGVRSIGDYVFTYCTYLNKVTFLGDAPTFSSNAFQYNRLTVYYPMGNDTWTDEVMQQYGGNEITWVAKDTSVIDSGTFGRNDCLSWWLSENGVLTISGTGAMPDWTLGTAPWYENRSRITAIKIASGVTNIGAYAFARCAIEEISEEDIPSGVTGIGKAAFLECKSLTDVTLGKGPQSIGESAFDSCSSLKTAVIPNSVKSIGDYAFDYCVSLEIAVIPSNVKSIGLNAFHSCDALTIYGQSGSSAETYARLNNIPFRSGEPGDYIDQLSFTEEDISGTSMVDISLSVHGENGTISGMSYSDDYFQGSPYDYSNSLAEISLGAAMSAFTEGTATPATKSEKDASSVIRGFFTDIGIDKATVFTQKFNDNKSTENSAGFAIGVKCIGQDSGGEDIYLVPIIVRGFGYGPGFTGEWASNFYVVQKDLANYSAGFVEAAEGIYDTVDDYLDYLTGLGISKDNMRLWVCGFSRGAATANYLSVLLDDNSGVDRSHIFTYCFATPNVAKKSEITGNYNNIWNIINELDIVPRVPLNEWGYDRYGQKKYLPCATNSGPTYMEYYDQMTRQFSAIMAEEGNNLSYTSIFGQEDSIDLLLNTLDEIIPTENAYYESGTQNLLFYIMSGQKKTADAFAREIMIAVLSTNAGGYAESITDFFANYSRRTLVQNSACASAILAEITASGGKVAVPIIKLLSVFAASETTDMVNQGRTNYSQRYENLAKLLCGLLNDDRKQGALLLQHWPETYLSWLRTWDRYSCDIFNPVSHKDVSIKCPVDVVVTNSAGEVVCRIVNDEVDESIEKRLYAYVEGDEKYICVTDDDTYTITVTAREDGEVSIVSTAYDAEDNRGETVVYVEEPMTEAEEFVMTGETVTADGRTLTPDITYTGEEAVQMSVSTVGSGLASGEGEYNIGDTVLLYAQADEGSVFCGWYTADGECVSNDESCRYLILEDTEIQAVFAENIGITLDREYLALQEGGDTQMITASVDPEILSPMVQWSVETETDPAIISVDENGVVTPLNPGTAYVVASLSLNGSEPVMAHCRIDVTDSAVAEAIENNTVDIRIGLAQTAAAVNIYSTDYTELTVVPVLEQNLGLMSTGEAENTGAAVTAAEFADEATAAYFRLRVKDDRTLVIIPKDGVPEAVQSGTMKPAKSYTSSILVTIAGSTVPYETAALKLTVSASLPKLKAGAVKFNTYDPGSAQPLTFTGAAVTGLDWNGAAPAGLVLNSDEMTVALDTENAPTKAGKLSLLAAAEGYAVTIPVTVSYSFANQAPAIKLKSSGLSVLSGSSDKAVTTFTITPAVFAEDPYEVTLQSIFEGTQTVANGSGLTVEIGEDNTVTVSAPEAAADGKTHTYAVNLIVENNDTDSTVGKAVKLTVKVLPAFSAAKPTVKLSASASGSIDTAVAASPIRLTARLTGFHAGSGETWSVTVEQYRAKTGTSAEVRNDVTGRFNITGENGVYVLTQNADADLEQGYTYNAYVSVDIDGDGTADVTSKAVKLGVKWSASAKVPVSVTLKASGSIDPLRPAGTVVITPAFRNCYDYEIAAEDLLITKTVGKVKTTMRTGDEGCPFTVTAENGTYVLCEKETGAVAAQETAAKYTVAFSAEVHGKAVTSKAVTLTVKAGKTVIEQSTKAVSLIRADRYDSAIIRLTPADGLNAIASATLDSASARLYDLKPLGNGYYEICFHDNTVTTGTKSLTAKITVKLEGAPANDKGAAVSVKISLVTVK